MFGEFLFVEFESVVFESSVDFDVNFCDGEFFGVFF